MKDAPFTLDLNDEETPTNLMEILSKYLRRWPWFLLSLLVTLALGYAYLLVAPTTYQSAAKIEIIDDSKELDVSTDALSLLSGNAQINLDNETEVLKSYRLLSQVVKELNLDVAYYQQGKIRATQIWNPPFIIYKEIPEDSLYAPKAYTVNLHPGEIVVKDEKDKVFNIAYAQLDSTLAGLPFRISLPLTTDTIVYDEATYKVIIQSQKETVLDLAKNLVVQPTNKNSDILTLSLLGESPLRSEIILNTVIDRFNQDGILDRQLVSKRTLDFIDERFVYLSGELDSIEGGKEDFKRANNLSYIEADAGVSLERKAEVEDDVANLESQISLSALLKNTIISQADYGLLPVDIGLESGSLNSLVLDYNELALERDKLITNVGAQHPSLVSLSEQLERTKANVLRTINIYQTQLRTSLRQLNREKNRANTVFSKLPEKEKMLRAIERQQSIKENLFLLLLQKREEAAINLAVTAPSIKIIDYGLTQSLPVAPKKIVVMGISLLIGLFLPFGILYIGFAMNSKIQERSDLESNASEISVLGEIPHLRKIKKFHGAHDRTILAESFRILATNVNYFLPKSNAPGGKVVYVTSSVGGEGKSLLAYNLSVAFASLNKKVLLLDAD